MAAVTAPTLRAAGSWWCWHEGRALTLGAFWIPAVLWLDRTATPAGQLLLGALTWALLLWLLAAESPAVRVQTAVVVVIASLLYHVAWWDELGR